MKPMKRISYLILLITVLTHPLLAQDVNKLIKEKQVSKIINTLAADDMRGRSALSPEDINKAGAFIEKEFKRQACKRWRV